MTEASTDTSGLTLLGRPTGLPANPEAARLEATATARFAVNKSVIRIKLDKLTEDGIPEALAETLPLIPVPEKADAWALVCRARTCLPPITDAESLLEALESQDGEVGTVQGL